MNLGVQTEAIANSFAKNMEKGIDVHENKHVLFWTLFVMVHAIIVVELGILYLRKVGKESRKTI